MIKLEIGDLVSHTILEYMRGVVIDMNEDKTKINVKWFTENKGIKNIKNVWNKIEFSPLFLVKVG